MPEPLIRSRIVVVRVVVAGIMAVHLSVDSMGLIMAVKVGRVNRVGHITVAVAGVALSDNRDGVGRMGGSDAGIVVVVVAVPVSGVVGSVAQMVGSVVGSVVGRSTVGVGGSRDHSLTGSSAHVHLLGMTHAPLVNAMSIARSVTSSVTISSISIAMPVITIAAITTIAVVASLYGSQEAANGYDKL